MIKIPKTDCTDNFTMDFTFFNFNNNKCKDNKTNNGEDNNDQTHTPKTMWIDSVAP